MFTGTGFGDASGKHAAYLQAAHMDNEANVECGSYLVSFQRCCQTDRELWSIAPTVDPPVQDSDKPNRIFYSYSHNVAPVPSQQSDNRTKLHSFSIVSRWVLQRVKGSGLSSRGSKRTV